MTVVDAYLHEESLRREINEGLNVVENWNSANGFIFYGKSGEIATNRLDDQELSVLSRVDGTHDGRRLPSLVAVGLYACQSLRDI